MDESHLATGEDQGGGQLYGVKYWLPVGRWNNETIPRYLLPAEILSYLLTMGKSVARKEAERWTAGRWEAAWGHGWGEGGVPEDGA